MKLKFLPGFRATFLIVGVLFIILSLSLFVRGLVVSMARFEVPETVLNSPHYYDAIFWTYTHMTVIGLLLICIGYSVSELKNQKWISFILLVISSIYTYMDFRSSDTAWGNGLYKGEASVIPAFISLFTTLLFLQLFLRILNEGKRFKAANQPHPVD